MNIKALTEKYKKHFHEYYSLLDGNTDGRQPPARPDFLQEVILPILDRLPEALPGYGFKPPEKGYAMYGEYYRSKCGITLLGGFSVNEKFELFFTPLFRSRPCGKPVRVTDMEQLSTELLKQIRRK